MNELQRRVSCSRLNYIKRVCAVFLCCCIVVGFLQPRRPAKAVVVAAAVPAVGSVLMDIIATCGVTLLVRQAYENVVTDVWEQLDPEEQDELIDNIIKFPGGSGREVIGGESGIHKYVVDIADNVWQAVKRAVDALYNPGNNYIYSGAPQEVDLNTEQNIISYLVGVSNNLPVYLEYNNRYQVTWNLSNGQIVRDTYDITYESHSYYYYSNSEKVIITVGSTYVSVWVGSSDGNTGVSSSYTISTVNYMKCGGMTEVGSVSASPNVDDLDYEWPGNDYTGKKQIVLTPETDTKGNIKFDESGYPVVDPDKAAEAAVGLTPEAIASVDPSGVPYTQPESIPENVPTVDTQEQPEQGSEGNTSLKALFFSKFPFCLPWDIKAAFELLVSNPEPPEWDIDLVPSAIRQQCGIHSDTTWHINMDDFEVVGQVSRWTSTIGFCICLIVLTRKIIRS